MTHTVEALKQILDTAHKELCEAVHRQWHRQTPVIRMSIPAREDQDTDLVIGAAIREAERAIDELVSENQGLRQVVLTLYRQPSEIDGCISCGICNELELDGRIKHAPDCMVVRLG